MTKASDNAFPSILITEGTEPSAPAAGKQRLYIDSTSHHLMRTNSSGTETDIESAAAGSVATDTIWDAAGDLAVGTGSNTAARLAKGSDGGVLAMGNGAVIWNAGTSFPASKATNDRYFRTDLGMEFFWDGTRWVSVQLFAIGLTTQAAALSANGVSGWVGLPGQSYGIYWVDMFLAANVATTNDGTKYWTADLHDQQKANGADASVKTLNTSTFTASQWHSIAGTIGAVSAGPILCYVDFTKTSTPGNAYLAVTARYRIIAT